MLGLSFAVLAMGCAGSHEPVAPMAGLVSEALAVEVTHRDLAPGELAQWVRITGGRRSVTIDVVRPAFCATLVSAVAHRASGLIDVIASVGGNPAADCLPAPSTFVVAYRVSVPQVAPGRVTVRLFELTGDRPPAFRGQSNLSIDP